MDGVICHQLMYVFHLLKDRGQNSFFCSRMWRIVLFTCFYLNIYSTLNYQWNLHHQWLNTTNSCGFILQWIWLMSTIIPQGPTVWSSRSPNINLWLLYPTRKLRIHSWGKSWNNETASTKFDKRENLQKSFRLHGEDTRRRRNMLGGEFRWFNIVTCAK